MSLNKNTGCAVLSAPVTPRVHHSGLTRNPLYMREAPRGRRRMRRPAARGAPGRRRGGRDTARGLAIFLDGPDGTDGARAGQ